MYGWAGQRLKVYLSEGKIIKEELSEELRLNYLGGRGLNAKTLFDAVKPGVDPLGPDNVFMVSTSPLTGTIAPCTGRWTVTAKSPLTSIFGDGNGGGDFAAELKFAGYDQVIFYGRAAKPVYLWIDDDKVELRDASRLWGKTPLETHEALVKELGDREVREMCIGPAGENLVRYATLFSNIARCAGWPGIGAVAGSKNLKAVAVRGSGSVKIAHPERFHKLVKECLEKIMAVPWQKVMRTQGTMALIRSNAANRSLRTKNAQQEYFEGWENVCSETLEKKYSTGKHRGCYACPIHCGHYYEVKEGPYATHWADPEYGAIAPFTTEMDSDNLAAALLAKTMCDCLGMSAATCGDVITFAMEAWQRGLITAKDTDGLDLTWGNMEAVIPLIRKIAYREGFGNLLAEGSRIASKSIPGSEAFALNVKGMEMGANYPSLTRNKIDIFKCALSTRGFDHLRGGFEFIGHPRIEALLGKEKAKSLLIPHTYSGKGVLTATGQDFRAAADSLEICYFVNGIARGEDYTDMAALFSAVTGVELSGEEFLKVGERVVNVERAFNAREGMRRKDDAMPQRYYIEAPGDDPSPGFDPAKYEALLDEYYAFRGWDKEGVPTKKRLEELGLGYIAPQIGAH